MNEKNPLSLAPLMWNLRIFLVETPTRTHPDYLHLKHIYQTNMQKFHSYYIKFITKVNTNILIPNIKLIGFDGTIKKKYNIRKFKLKQLFADIDKMPMGKLKKEQITPKNMSLFSNYHPKTSKKGYGFKNSKIARKTIKKIKNKKPNYQKQVLTTLIGRAKFHPHPTKNIKEAQLILQSYLNKLKTQNK